MSTALLTGNAEEELTQLPENARLATRQNVWYIYDGTAVQFTQDFKQALASHYAECLKDSDGSVAASTNNQSHSYRILRMWPSDGHSWLENI